MDGPGKRRREETALTQASASSKVEARKAKLAQWKATQAARVAAAAAAAAPAAARPAAAKAAAGSLPGFLRKPKGAGSAAAAGGGSSSSSGGRAGAAVAAPADDDVDPLDAFMAEQVMPEARQKVIESMEKAVRVEAAVASGSGLASDDEPDEEEGPNMMKHCYICKAYGHTKGDCPEKKCNFCQEPGHELSQCPKHDEHLRLEALKDKQRKREKFYAKKKAKRQDEWEWELRRKTGNYGYKVLYKVLGLQVGKLATEQDIKKAYRKQSLKFHPDKQHGKTEEEAEEASQKFIECKAAYDLLLEGMRTGQVEGQSVFSAGDIMGSTDAHADSAAAWNRKAAAAGITAAMVVSTAPRLKIDHSATGEVDGWIDNRWVGIDEWRRISAERVEAAAAKAAKGYDPNDPNRIH